MMGSPVFRGYPSFFAAWRLAMYSASAFSRLSGMAMTYWGFRSRMLGLSAARNETAVSAPLWLPATLTTCSPGCTRPASQALATISAFTLTFIAMRLWVMMLMGLCPSRCRCLMLLVSTSVPRFTTPPRASMRSQFSVLNCWTPAAGNPVWWPTTMSWMPLPLKSSAALAPVSPLVLATSTVLIPSSLAASRTAFNVASVCSAPPSS